MLTLVIVYHLSFGTALMLVDTCVIHFRFRFQAVAACFQYGARIVHVLIAYRAPTNFVNIEKLLQTEDSRY